MDGLCNVCFHFFVYSSTCISCFALWPTSTTWASAIGTLNRRIFCWIRKRLYWSCVISGGNFLPLFAINYQIIVSIDFFVLCLPDDQSIDWLIEWLIEFALHWLWLLDWSIDWLIDWSTHSHQNIASIKPRMKMLKRPIPSKNPLRNVVLCYVLKSPRKLFLFSNVVMQIE